MLATTFKNKRPATSRQTRICHSNTQLLNQKQRDPECGVDSAEIVAYCDCTGSRLLRSEKMMSVALYELRITILTATITLMTMIILISSFTLEGVEAVVIVQVGYEPWRWL